MSTFGRIAILTGGGDCPGMNAVIRAVAKKAILEHNLEIIGIEDGYDGAVLNHYRKLQFRDVSGIITQGGTILGTSNKANPFRYAVDRNGELKFEDVSKETISNLKKLEIDCLVCIGGDGTLNIANRLYINGIPVVGIPKTIDNDLRGTDITFGFDSAVSMATDAIDRLHSTAQSHHRVMVLEVMGRNSGWIALHAGVAGGGDIILIPEIPYSIDRIVKKVRQRSNSGQRFSIIVVAEGVRSLEGKPVVNRLVEQATDPVRLGGIGLVVGKQVEESTGIETRTVVLGHLQRGGTPTAFDRVLATRLGTRAVDNIINKRFGYMVGVQNNELKDVPLAEVSQGQRTVSPDDPLIASARSVGTCFGD